MTLPSNPNNDANLVDLTATGAELLLDAGLESGLIKDIPLFGSIAKIVDATKNMKDYLLQKKLVSFLKAAKSNQIEKDTEFILKIRSDEGYANKVSENLMLVIDQLDEVTKPVILGTAFSWLCQNKLTYVEFSRISSGLRYCMLSDLEELSVWANDESAKIKQWGLASQSLVSAGFLFMLPQGAIGSKGYEVSISDVGKKLGVIVHQCVTDAGRI